MQFLIKNMNGKWEIIEALEVRALDTPETTVTIADYSSALNDYHSARHALAIANAANLAAMATAGINKATEIHKARRKHRTGNANYHNSKYYKSVIAASVATGVKRYWVDKYCNEEVGGWKWA